jgi:hypothetical protein
MVMLRQKCSKAILDTVGHRAVHEPRLDETVDLSAEVQPLAAVETLPQVGLERVERFA